MEARRDYCKSRIHKSVSILFGSIFIGIAVVLIVIREPQHDGLLYFLAVVLFALLGLDQIISALKERDSIMDRFGGLP
jgi:hypothetical protein